LGRFVQNRWPDQAESVVRIEVGAALAFLGFLLVFVTGIAIGNFDQRRQLVVSEVIAIGTTCLRAGFMPDSFGLETRELLREYINLRIKAGARAASATAIARSKPIHDELWLLAKEDSKKDPGPTIALYLSSMNEVIDLHTESINARLDYLVPPGAPYIAVST
jgi:hypothetical protein